LSVILLQGRIDDQVIRLNSMIIIYHITRERVGVKVKGGWGMHTREGEGEGEEDKGGGEGGGGREAGEREGERERACSTPGIHTIIYMQ